MMTLAMPLEHMVMTLHLPLVFRLNMRQFLIKLLKPLIAEPKLLLIGPFLQLVNLPVHVEVLVCQFHLYALV